MSQELHHLGLNFLVGLSGPKLNHKEESLLKALEPSGIILFSRNIDRTQGDKWPEHLRELITKAHTLSNRTEFLVSVDHEGGRIHRFLPPVTHFPEARHWAHLSHEVGMTMGKELRSLGFNLNFAPVLDIHSEPKNEVIGLRAFGTSPGPVIESALAFIKGQESTGVLACGKHFPGHGATLADSHFELPVLDLCANDLKSRELVPFEKSIGSDLHLLMTAHVLYTELDNALPATLSKPIIQNLLRKQLGYTRAVISDDLGMRALDSYGEKTLPVKIIEAGVDILLVGNMGEHLALEQASSSAQHLLEELDAGRLEEQLIRESQGRVRSLFEHLQAIQAGSCSFDKGHSILNCEKHQSLLKRIKQGCE